VGGRGDSIRLVGSSAAILCLYHYSTDFATVFNLSAWSDTKGNREEPALTTNLNVNRV